jgi:two-component system chemotaxis sensor kinase CheA
MPSITALNPRKNGKKRETPHRSYPLERHFTRPARSILKLKMTAAAWMARKLAAEAVEKGLYHPGTGGKLSSNEQLQLIFLPGFSMVQKVTDLSGRGVGMDVVKTNLDRLGGQIDLATEAGKGTTVRIKVPLTLAIIPSQIIVTENERYAIPTGEPGGTHPCPRGTRYRNGWRSWETRKWCGCARGCSRWCAFPICSAFGEPIPIPEERKAPKSDRRERIADRRSRKSDLFGSL